MQLSRLGRVLFATVAALMLWLVATSLRRADTFGTIVYALMALMFGLPAVFGRESFTAHTVPMPRGLRWLYKSPSPESHPPITPPAP